MASNYLTRRCLSPSPRYSLQQFSQFLVVIQTSAIRTVDVIPSAFMNGHNIALNNLAANQQVSFFQNVPQCSRMHLVRTAILPKVYIIVPAGTMILLGVQIEHSRDIDQRVQA